MFQYNYDNGGLCRVGKHVEVNRLADMMGLGRPDLSFVKRSLSAVKTGTKVSSQKRFQVWFQKQSLNTPHIRTKSNQTEILGT